MGNPVESLAAVGLDLGSNTFSCVAVSAASDSHRVIDDVSVPVRLSEGLTNGGSLLEPAIQRGLNALRDLAERFSMKNRPVRAVATQALRMAADPQRFIEPAEEIIGTSIEVVDGEEEALLAAKGALHDLPLPPGPTAVVDVGGQSTEVCRRQSAHEAWNCASVAVGVVGLKEQFFDGDPPSRRSVQSLQDYVSRHFSWITPSPGETLVAIAGTATALAMVDQGLTAWNRGAVHGRRMTGEAVNRWLKKMLEMTTHERAQGFGLGPARGDVFPVGLAVLKSLMAIMNTDALVVSANGMRVGAALSLYEEN